MPVATRRAALAALALGPLAAPARTTPALAQAWPAGPIRITVPFPPGGSVDTVTRLLQPALQAELGATIVVENRGGASGALGTAQVARAAPDGQAFVMVFDTHATNPALIPGIGFDTRRDLVPVWLLGTAPNMMLGHRTRPFTTMADVVQEARARPDTVTYGTIGNGSLALSAWRWRSARAASYQPALPLTDGNDLRRSKIASGGRGANGPSRRRPLVFHESLTKPLGITLVHAPYRGGGPLAVAAMAGETDLAVATGAALAQPIQQGVLRPLAVMGPRRRVLLPEVPTMAEAGLPGAEAEAFWGLLAPAATPPAILARMEAAARRATEVPEVRERLTGVMGIELRNAGGAEFGRFLEAEMAKWARVIRENDIRPD